jgi:peroxiredoxin
MNAMQRRTWIYAAVGASAAALGASAAWWRLRPNAQPDEAWQALWSQEFEAPNGSKLAMRDFKGQKLLLNFWATWCPPCVQEMPMLDRFYRENHAKGWQVLAIAADKADAVRKFAQEKNLQLPLAIANSAALDWSRRLGNTGGGLPYTVVLGADGRIVHQRIGRLSEQDLSDWLKP